MNSEFEQGENINVSGPENVVKSYVLILIDIVTMFVLRGPKF